MKTHGTISTLAGGVGQEEGRGDEDDICFQHPMGICVTADDCVIVADFGNNHIFKVAVLDGSVTKIALSVTPCDGDDMALGDDALPTINDLQQSMKGPRGVAVDGSGNILIADSDAHCIRKIWTDGKMSIVAGSGKGGYAEGKGSQACGHLSIPCHGIWRCKYAL